MSTPIHQLLSLEGKTALVTGGSRGLGLQIAEALGEAGARVMLTSRKAGDLEESAGHLKERGIEAIWIAADMSQPSEIVRVTQDAMSRLGHVDILVNNAGATWGCAAEDHPLEAWDKVMNLNIRSIFLLSQAIGKHSMIPRKAGKIINVASIAGLAGNSADMAMVAYNTSKAAVVNFTRTLAGEWGKYNINVNAICPGTTVTALSQANLERRAEEEGLPVAEMEKKRNDAIPLGRPNTPSDIAALAVFLASAGARNITGQSFNVDGGLIFD